MAAPTLLRWVADLAASCLTFIPAAMCRRPPPGADAVHHWFLFWTQMLATVPGLPGVFLRRGFYRRSLERCGRNVYIGFGALFTQQTAVVDEDVYIGPYALVGSAWLKKGALVGSRSSILSGGVHHERTQTGGWAPFSSDRVRRIVIGENVWIGEGALVLADVGEGTVIAAGSVVSAPVRDNVVVAGNPSRLARNLDAPMGVG